MSDPTLLHLDGPATMNRFDEIQEVYAAAFPGYSLDDQRWRVSRQAASPGFDTVAAEASGHLIGFVYGLPLGPKTTWWDGLTPPHEAEFTAEPGTRTFAVIDLAVLPASRGQGLGRTLIDELLGSRSEDRATLATDPAKRATQEMYERWGWRKVGQTPGGSRATQAAYDIYIIALRPGVDSSSR
ncbi:GNAT family N-acetyltransferase [Actinoallomurus liliacearum]|uniref:GNAT family N-acetyltransferase n=1 Tax=Actinoallomurus liliacearum TaxID=1080073 RepID=A0ABP8TYJ9_9ACTN